MSILFGINAFEKLGSKGVYVKIIFHRLSEYSRFLIFILVEC